MPSIIVSSAMFMVPQQRATAVLEGAANKGKYFSYTLHTHRRNQSNP